MLPINFRKLKETDLELMHQWFNEPVIYQHYARSKFWTLSDIRKKYLPRILGDENIPSFIVHLGDQPIGFIQYYSLKDVLPEEISNYHHHLFDHYNSHEVAGIDLFIAESKNRGKGLGSKIINDFIEKFLKSHFKAIVVDPDQINTQAIRCYEKSGFLKTNYSSNKQYLIMLLTLKN